MALTTRVWGAGKLLLLGGALLLTYVLFAAAAMRVALRTREVVVPDLAGKTVNDATVALSEAGLNLKVEEARRPDPKVPAGQILAQDPRPGPARAASAASRSGSAPALVRPSSRRCSASPNAPAALQLQQDGLRADGRFRDSIVRIPVRRRDRPDACAEEQRAAGGVAGQSRRTRSRPTSCRI